MREDFKAARKLGEDAVKEAEKKRCITLSADT